MPAVTSEILKERLELADLLRAGRRVMISPQDLPGRYGRAVKAVDRLLQAVGAEAVLAGGWAVWRHGFAGRVTQDLDIVLPADRVDDFLRVASVSGFEVLPQPPGRWPKVRYKDADMEVDILPEGGRPGTPSRPAPTTIPPPAQMGASGPSLKYIRLASLIELKIAAGRARDESDVVELVRANMNETGPVRQHLAGAHPDYAIAFDRLVERAREQTDA
jgi:hypothetical protein